MTSANRPDRRTAIRLAGAGAGVLAAGGLLSACTGGDSTPDPLIALADSAHQDAALAEAVFAAHPDLAAARAIGKARRAQEAALRKEIGRAAGTTTSTTASNSPGPAAPKDRTAAVGALTSALSKAQDAAGALVPTVPTYRAGLVGSVAAGCAALRELFT